MATSRHSCCIPRSPTRQEESGDLRIRSRLSKTALDPLSSPKVTDHLHSQNVGLPISTDCSHMSNPSSSSAIVQVYFIPGIILDRITTTSYSYSVRDSECGQLRVGVTDRPSGLRQVQHAAKRFKDSGIVEPKNLKSCSSPFSVQIYFGPSINTLIPFPFLISSNACTASSKLTFFVMSFLTSIFPLEHSFTAAG